MLASTRGRYRMLLTALLALLACCTDARPMGPQQAGPGQMVQAAAPARREHEAVYSSDGMMMSGMLGNPAACKSDPAGKSPYNYDMTDHAKTCADAANQACPTCSLWTAHRIAPNDACVGAQKTNCKNSYYYIGPGSPGAAYLALPSFATRGVEDVYHNTNGARTQGKLIWQHAWADAAKAHPTGGANGRSGFNVAHAGALVVNAPTYRSKHQMHIHVGDLDTTSAWNLFVRDCLPDLVKKSTASAKTTKPVACSVTGFKKDASGAYKPFATPADFLAVTTTDLSTAWQHYVDLVDKHPASKQWADWRNHVGVLVTEVPGKKGTYLVVLYSGPGDYVGDYSFLKE